LEITEFISVSAHTIEH